MAAPNLSRLSQPGSNIVSEAARQVHQRFAADPAGASRRSLDPNPAEEEDLRRAALEALNTPVEAGKNGKGGPLSQRRLAVLPEDISDHGGGKFRPVDVSKLTHEERKFVVSKALATEDPDNEKFLTRLRDRMNRVGIQLSTVEVRFENLSVTGKVFVGDRALPTVSNEFRTYIETALSWVGVRFASKRDFPIIKNISSTLRPGRFTLLLGPPGSGKTTLLKALAGKLDTSSLKQEGQITFNGHTMDEFVPERTAAYVEQVDNHIAELTVRETFDFAARVQGVGHKAEELRELMEKEKEMNVSPDYEIDAFMKAEAAAGNRFSVVTELVLRLLGIDHVAETFVGGPMLRGISGGQKKRVTTGEIVVGPTKTLFMDEISTGLDSSTTFQIIKCYRNFAHLRDATVLVALLQPAPEVYDLFDDVMLLSEGHLVYHGPVDEVVPFFSSMGFKLPERKGIADFLQEVTSSKDQGQYWAGDEPYKYVTVEQFAEANKNTPSARATAERLAVPYDKSTSHPGALATHKYGVTIKQVLRATLRREMTLMQRNAFIYVFQTCQVSLNALILATLFFRTTLHQTDVDDANLYGGVLFFSLIAMLFNNFAEFSLIVDRLAVFYKQRDNLFYPSWAFALPFVALGLPMAILQSFMWSVITYWIVGLAPEASRFFIFWLFMFLMHSMAVALFRLVGVLTRTQSGANALAIFTTLVIVATGGYTLDKGHIRGWWIWAYWINPMAWAQNSICINEFLAPRWQKPNPPGGPSGTIGDAYLSQHAFHNKQWWIWAGAGYVAAIILLFNALIIVALAYLSNHQAAGSIEEDENELGLANGVAGKGDHNTVDLEKLDTADLEPVSEKAVQANGTRKSFQMSHTSVDNKSRTSIDNKSRTSMDNKSADGSRRSLYGASKHSLTADIGARIKEGDLVGREEGIRTKEQVAASAKEPGDTSLPFEQLYLTFHNVWYSVNFPSGTDIPENARKGEDGKPRLYLLNNVSGAFRPHVLTALVGQSGAGKTTLFDVIAGRKTGGIIEGDIRVQGHPKVQSTFSRVSGYIEQNDIHTSQQTIREALQFSARMRLPASVDRATSEAFVEEILEVVELTTLQHALVGTPGESGLSVEQRKRLTIAVELVANPSLVFMDEPTSGLDARAAAIVMRAVRNTVDTGRTVVCTIHQPSIDIFEAFDELLLMKRGGRIIYFGPLGTRSNRLVTYFEKIQGVPKIVDGINPATWVLDITNQTAERRLGVDFADLYDQSQEYKNTVAMIEELSVPPPGTEPLHFNTVYSHGAWKQFLVILGKNNGVYWRTPAYNSIRMVYTTLIALIFGTLYWSLGHRKATYGDILNIMGALFGSAMFLGSYNASSVQPIVAAERNVFYRERAAGYFATFPYAVAAMVVEIPYLLMQTLLYSIIVYATAQFDWTAAKFFWFMFFQFLNLSVFTFFGIATVSLTPNVVVAGICSGAVYFNWALFCGFVIAVTNVPGWWVWVAYCDPVAYTLWGIVSSQLGDFSDVPITLPNGQISNVAAFLRFHFRFPHELLYVPVIMLLFFAAFFCILTACSLRYINFQNR